MLQCRFDAVVLGWSMIPFLTRSRLCQSCWPADHAGLLIVFIIQHQQPVSRILCGPASSTSLVSSLSFPFRILFLQNHLCLSIDICMYLPFYPPSISSFNQLLVPDLGSYAFFRPQFNQTFFSKHLLITPNAPILSILAASFNLCATLNW